MKPQSIREAHWWSEVWECQFYKRSPRTRIWKRFAKRQLSKARRRHGRFRARQLLTSDL